MPGWFQRKMSDRLADNISKAYWGEVDRLKPFAAAWATGVTLPLDRPVPPTAPLGSFENFTADGTPATRDGVLRMHRLAWKVAQDDVRALRQIPLSTVRGIEQAHLHALMMRAGITATEDNAGDEPEILRVGRRLAEEDPEMFGIAQEVVSDWLERFPDVADAAGRSDGGATTSARMMIEAFAAGRAAQAAIAAANTDPDELFNDQVAIAQEQAERGVTDAWVVAFCQLRCIAVGYVMGLHGPPADADRFRILAQELFARG